MSVSSIDGFIPEEYSYEANAGKKTQTKDLDKNAFLLLFIESLKGQDPTTPQDPNEFMSQMAQFSMLEQLTNMNSEIAKVKHSQEISQASGLIGHNVTIYSDQKLLEGQVDKITIFQNTVQVYLKGDQTGYDLSKVIEVL